MKTIEKILLGRCLTSVDEATPIFAVLTVDDFRSYPKEAQLLKEAWEENISFATKLRTNGFTVSDYFCDDYTSSISKLTDTLKRKNAADDIVSIFNEYIPQVNEKNIEEIVSNTQLRLLNTITHTKKEDHDIDYVIDSFHKTQELYEEKRRTGQTLLGKSTGFEKLDNIIDGIREGHLWILGGYTNLGKTYGALNILTNLMKQGERTIFYSLEMTKVDILARILGILTEHNGNSIVKGGVDKPAVDKALETVRRSGFSVFKDKNDISEIVFSIHEECVRKKPALVVIDFLQLVTCKSARTEYEATTTAILELQKAAQRYNVPIIVLSQVSNESAKNGDQQVMGFKGSGGIAAAADLAIELVSGEDNVNELRRKMNDNEPVKIKWHIKKNRHGKVGSILMQFNGKCGIFEDYDKF